MREERPRQSRLRDRRRPATPQSDPVADPLEVPKWAHPKVSAYDLEPEDRKRELRQRQVRTTQRALPARDGYLIGMAIAPGATSIVALAVASVPFLSGAGDIPAGIVLVLLMQVGAIAILGQMGLGQWTPSWIAVGFMSSVMLPMLALQMSLLREPYVSVGMGSARPAILATLVVLGLYGAFCVWVCWVGTQQPPVAAVLLMPSTLVIPAMIGEAGMIDQRDALLILAEVTLFTAIAAAFSWLFPGWTQLLVGAAAFAMEMIRLWAGGAGPWRHETSGAIVSTLYLIMLFAAAVAIVLVPTLCAMASAPAGRRRTGRPRGRAAVR